MDLTKFFPTSNATKPLASVQHHFDAPDFVTARDRADPDFWCQGSEDAAKRAAPSQEEGKRKMPRKKKRKIIAIPSIHEDAAPPA